MGDSEQRTRTIATNGVELFVREAGPADGPLVVLVHGFPELSYSWRHQIAPLAAAGYHVVAPDMRGYGESSRPEAITDYDIVHLTDDLVGLVDAIDGPDAQAVFIGHDWGAMVVWQLSLLHPSRLRGVAALSVPFQRRALAPPIGLMRERFAGSFFYIVYFQEPGVADADLDADPATTMRRLFAPSGVQRAASAPEGESFDPSADDGRGFVERMIEPDELPDWITEEEVAVYADTFRRTGFTGGLNWYRNFDRNWELTPHLAGVGVSVPSFFIGGTADPVLTITPVRKMDGWLADHRGSVLLDGAGHWIQQERPAEVNAALLEFLAGL